MIGFYLSIYLKTSLNSIFIPYTLLYLEMFYLHLFLFS